MYTNAAQALSPTNVLRSNRIAHPTSSFLDVAKDRDAVLLSDQIRLKMNIGKELNLASIVKKNLKMKSP